MCDATGLVQKRVSDCGMKIEISRGDWVSDMMTQELEQNLRSLSPIDQMAAIQILVEAIDSTSRGVAKIPGVMGGEACIRGTRIPIWLLVSYRNQGMTDGEILKEYPDLSVVDLFCVWAYAKVYGAEIAAAIRDQEEIDELQEI
jgi:uncharacterized protein (DUF433 family)